MKLYGWDPRKINYYDLVINTAQVDIDSAVEIIVAALRIKNGATAAAG